MKDNLPPPATATRAMQAGSVVTALQEAMAAVATRATTRALPQTQSLCCWRQVMAAAAEAVEAAVQAAKAAVKAEVVQAEAAGAVVDWHGQVMLHNVTHPSTAKA